MAPPPKPPPPPGYFERRAALAAAKAKTTAAQASTSLVLAPPPSAVSYTDTIADVTPFISITLDLAAHNYYHWCHLFEVHLGRCNLRGHVDDSIPPRDDSFQGDALEARVLDDLTRAAGLASASRIADRLGATPSQVESALKALVRRGRARTCRWADGVFYEAITRPER